MSTRHADTFFGGWQFRNDAAVRTGPERVPTGTARRRMFASGAALAVVAGAVIAPLATAGADPSAHTWWRLRECESSNRYYLDTGNGHYGAYQFDLATWHSVGGTGYPNQASKAEQDARALILYRERGWEPWQCAGILGLRPDKDAASGYIGDIHVPTGHGGGSRHGIPAFPGGSHYYVYGDWNDHIKAFQNELHHRGFFPVGTGQYGPKTLHAVKRLQRLNGLPPTGDIGPNTWRLAWVGRYYPPGTGRPPRIPAFPGGSHYYVYGDWNNHIKTFQNEMHRRGYFPPGTGQYGPKTLHMVKRLQRRNGLAPNGDIGPNTWRLAWVGHYRR
jgi:hypothetical protein